MLFLKEKLFQLSRNKFYLDSIWAFVGSAGLHGLSLVSSILIARYLGKFEYGEYSMIKSTLYQITYLSTFGFGHTVTRFVSKYISDRNYIQVNSVCKVASRITLVTGVIFSLLVFIFSQELAYFLEDAKLSSSLRLSAMIILLNSISTTQAGILSGFKAFKVLARNNLLNGFFLCLLSIIMTIKFGLDGALMALLFSFLFLSSINYLSVKKIRKNYPISKVDISLIKSLFNFSFPVVLQELAYSILHWLMMLMLMKFAGYGELGLYNIAAQWVAIVVFIPGVLKNVVLSYLSSDKNKDFIINFLLKFNFLVTFIPLLIVLLFSNFVVGLYGDNYYSLKSILCLYLLSSVFTSMSDVYNSELMSSGRTWTLLCFRFMRDIFILVGAYLLIHHFRTNVTLLFVIVSDSIAVIYFFFVHFYYKLSRKRA